MFSAPKMAAPAQDYGGIKATSLSTNQQARPVPVFGGQRRMGSTFITDSLNVTVQSVKSSGKGHAVTGQNVYGAWAALHCRGPVDEVLWSVWDNRVEWSGAIVRDVTNPDYVDITVPGRGVARLYWGTATQTAHPNLSTWDSGFVHSAYRNCCYSVWGPSIFLGSNRDSIPNIEWYLTKYPQPSWFTALTGGSTKIPGQAGVNPAAFLADFLQDTLCGPGLPDAAIDIASWNACGAALLSEGLGISPFVTRKQSLKSIIADVFGIVDGYLFLTGTGKIGMGLVRAVGGGLTTLDETNLTETPALDPEAWEDTINALSLVWRDIGEDMDVPALYRDRGNFQVTGVNRSQTAQRPWLDNPVNAQKVATAQGSRMALPRMTGRVVARRSVGMGLGVGGAFALGWAQDGISGLVMRVKQRTLPAPGEAPEVKFEIEEDHGFLNVDNFAPAHVAIPPAGETIDPPEQLLIEWPWTREFNVPMVAALLARTVGDASGFFVHAQRPSGSYEYEEFSNRFAMRGVVADVNYPADTCVIDRDLGMVVQMTSLDQEIDAIPLEDALLNEWLIVVGDEICSVFDADLIAVGKYRLQLVRARFDTVRAAHAIGATVWAFRKDSAPLFRATNEMETQARKLQQFIGGAAENLAGVTAMTCPTTQRWWRPIEPANLAAFGDRRNPTYSMGQDVPLTWTVRDAQRLTGWGDWEVDQTIDGPDTVIEFYNTDGDLLATWEVLFDNATAPASSYLISNADIVALLAFNGPFDLRAYHRRNGLRSARFAALRVVNV